MQRMMRLFDDDSFGYDGFDDYDDLDNCDDCDCHCGCEGCDYIAGYCCDDDHVYDDEDDGSSADVVLMMVMTNTNHVYMYSSICSYVYMLLVFEAT